MSRYFFAENALDAADSVLVFTGDEGVCIAGLFSPACAAYPMRVCIGGIGHIVVNNVGYA
jgi:hypothetical protein